MQQEFSGGRITKRVAQENKPSAWVSFAACRCPRCRKGKVFKYSAFNISKFAETYEACDTCQLQYSPETGFFFGAMYWSYAIIVGLLVTISVVMVQFDLLEYGIFILPLLVVAMLPFIFRYSRMLMLYLVYPVMYKEKYYGKGQ